jgi:putative transposase
VLDDFSRYIVAFRLCTTMAAADVTATLDLALQASGLDQVEVNRRPRLLSDNGPSYVATELADWLGEQGMSHSRGKPYHPMTQGKIERWHLSLKCRILLDNYYLPGDLERAVAAFVEHYNHSRYHESLDNLTPADVYFGRRHTILNTRRQIKRNTIEQRRRLHFASAA